MSKIKTKTSRYSYFGSVYFKIIRKNMFLMDMTKRETIGLQSPLVDLDLLELPQ